MFSKSISSDELAKMLDEYRRDYETGLQSRPNIEVQQARQLIQQARDLIRRSGIGDALTVLLEEVKYWPTWSERDDLVKSVHFPATDIHAKKERSSSSNLDRVSERFRVQTPPQLDTGVGEFAQSEASYRRDLICRFRFPQTSAPIAGGQRLIYTGVVPKPSPPLLSSWVES